MSDVSDRELKVGALIDGELPADERAEVESWLEQDADLRRTADEFLKLKSTASQTAAPSVSESEWNDTLSAIRQKASEPVADPKITPISTHPSSTSSTSSNSMLWAIAAIALVSVSLWIAFRDPNAGTGEGGKNLAEPAGAAEDDFGSRTAELKDPEEKENEDDEQDSPPSSEDL